MKNRGELLNADGSQRGTPLLHRPAFATRQEFQGRRGARAYRDKVAGAAFVEFLRKRLVFICELLADDGSLWLHLDTRKVHYLKVVWTSSSASTTSATRPLEAHDRAPRARDAWARSTRLSCCTPRGHPDWNQLFMPYDDWYVERYYSYEDGTERRYVRGLTGRAAPGSAAALRRPRRDCVTPPGFPLALHAQANLDAVRREAHLLHAQRRSAAQALPGRDARACRSGRLRPTSSPSCRGRPSARTTPPRSPWHCWSASSGVHQRGRPRARLLSRSGTTAVRPQRTRPPLDGRRLRQARHLRHPAPAPRDGEGSGQAHRARAVRAVRRRPLRQRACRGACLRRLQGVLPGALRLPRQAHTIAGVPMAGTRKGDPVHFFPFQDDGRGDGRASTSSRCTGG